MGYTLAYGPCLICRRLFHFNPEHVPSFPDPHPHGPRKPICRHCMEDVNEIRGARRLPPHPIHRDAYEPQEAF
jgi:hypothetical protein